MISFASIFRYLNYQRADITLTSLKALSSIGSFKQAPVHGLHVQIIRPRILCVDDETIGARIRGEILSEHGYSVVLYDCPLAVLHCDLSMFDPTILDFQMPGIKWPRKIASQEPMSPLYGQSRLPIGVRSTELLWTTTALVVVVLGPPWQPTLSRPIARGV